MKTPKRNYKIPTERQHLDMEPDSWDEYYKQQDARWKRKTRIRQLKHTIKVLTRALRDTEKALIETQKATKCFFFRPDHWHPQGPDGKQYTRKQWRQEMKARQSKSPLP